MNKKDIYALAILIVLTITTALFSTVFNSIPKVGIIILFLSSMKFLIIAFQFMDLSKANVFWKGLLVGFLSLFLVVSSIVIWI